MLATAVLRLALLSLCLASCAPRAQRSVALYEAGDYAGAARAADAGLATHPGDDGLWGMKVRAALALGDAAAVHAAYASYRERRGDHDRELLADVATAAIGQALAAPSARLQVAAIQAIEEAELFALLDALTERLGSDDDRVAAAAAVAVLRGVQHAPEVAGEMLKSPDPEARRIVVEGIGKKAGGLAVADLRRAAADRDNRVRRAAIRWLGQLRDGDAVPVLERNLRHPDDAVRAAAVTALTQIQVAPAARLALADRALRDTSLGVRLAGVAALAAAAQRDRLVTLAGDRDPIVALEAAIAADRPDLGAAALARAQASDRPEVRAGAANLAARAVGADAAVAVARALLADPSPVVRLAAARALASRDRAAAIAALVADGSLSAHTDLARLGDPRGEAGLDAAVRAPGAAEPRIAAAAAHRTARVITPGLVAALADASPLVRIEAAAAIVAQREHER